MVMTRSRGKFKNGNNLTKTLPAVYQIKSLSLEHNAHIQYNITLTRFNKKQVKKHAMMMIREQVFGLSNPKRDKNNS
jgi:hypothetical protein